jgi:stearoyl-CoA desaturase (delta-9 desaturase)
MFSLNKFWEAFFYYGTFLTQGPSFLNPRAYALMHQAHHMHSDTLDDPHSPLNSKGMVEMMLKTFKTYKKTMADKTLQYSGPVFHKLDQFAESYFNLFGWIIIYILVYASLGLSFWMMIIAIPLHSFMGPIQGAIVNWFGHALGYRNYNLPDVSRNTLPVDLLLMGELYQNNHHAKAKSINFAHKWFEFDPTAQIVKFLSILRILKIRS